MFFVHFSSNKVHKTLTFWPIHIISCTIIPFLAYYALLDTCLRPIHSMEIEILRQKVHFESIHFLPDLELPNAGRLYLF